jgi:hypothetical protein
MVAQVAVANVEHDEEPVQLWDWVFQVHPDAPAHEDAYDQ